VEAAAPLQVRSKLDGSVGERLGEWKVETGQGYPGEVNYSTVIYQMQKDNCPDYMLIVVHVHIEIC